MTKYRSERERAEVIADAWCYLVIVPALVAVVYGLLAWSGYLPAG